MHNISYLSLNLEICNTGHVKVLTTYGGSLIIRRPTRPQKQNFVPFSNRDPKPTGFIFDHATSGNWFSVFQVQTAPGQFVYYPFFKSMSFADCVNFNQGYLSYTNPQGLTGYLGEWMNNIVFPLIADKYTTATRSAWRAAN